MTVLFIEPYRKLISFIFDLYDMDNDGIVIKEDIKLILSYIPLNLKQKKFTFQEEKHSLP